MHKGRPRRSEKRISTIVRLFEDNKQYLVSNGKLQPRTSEVWNDLSTKICKVYTPLALFTMAAKNYYNLKETLEMEEEPKLLATFEPNDDEHAESELESGNISSEGDQASLNRLKFVVILTQEEYKGLNKHSEVYKREDISEKNNKYRNSNTREYTVFEQRHWTHILGKKIETNLRQKDNNCIINFKRNKIFVNNEKHFSEFYGYCKECNARLLGYIESAPTNDQDVFISCQLDNIKQHFKTYSKRPLSGKTRKELGEYLLNTQVAPSHYRKILASKDIELNYGKPSWIPKLGTLRVAKSERAKIDRLHDDPIYSICLMKVDPSMKGAIQNIGLDPFFVYIWANTHLHVYNRYCATEYAKLCIDATGSIVKKITKVNGEKSKHIFLYDCAVLSKTNRENQFSVCNMLSESQNAVSIYSWLAHWIRAGSATPQEVVTDMSLALMYAVTLAFTNCKTLEEYIQVCFDALINNMTFTEKCFIRLDVAHLLKLVSQWPSLKNQHRLTRTFYLKAVGQLIQSTEISDIESILKAIFTVALSDTEGVSIQTGDPTICETRKEWLKRRSSTGSIELLVESLISGQGNPDNSSIGENRTDSMKKNIYKSSFIRWATDIADDCKKMVNTSTEEGNRGNQQCLPAVLEDLLKICKYLPLWTAVMSKYFPSANIIASSAAVESNINDIKHRIFGNDLLPLRVDDFLKNFILSVDGANKLADSAIDELNKNITIEMSTCPSTPFKIDDASRPLDLEGSTKKVFCPSCQLNLNGVDFCSSCNKSIHHRNVCSVKTKQNTIFCLECSRLEQNSFENWRGLGSDAKKRRPRHSYLEPASELLGIDYTSLRKVNPIGIMRNGHLVDLKPIKLSPTVSVTLSNTCGFDSLIQLMAGGFCDSDTFKQLILFNTERSEVAKIITSLTKNGVNKNTYRIRADILMDIFNTQDNPCGILSLSVETEVGNLLRKLDFTYCAMERINCTVCSFLEVKFLHSIENTVTDTKLNILELQNLARYKHFKNCIRDNCDGKLRKKTEFALTHIFIEPLNVESKIFELYTSLDTIPKTIDINGTIYILRGVIGYVGPEQQIGHFICYCFRHNNIWQEFDDRQIKSQSCSPKKIVRVQILLYTL